MEQLMTFVLIVWLSLDGLIIATGWFAVATIKPRWPEWWRRVVADELPVAGSRWFVASCSTDNEQPPRMRISS